MRHGQQLYSNPTKIEKAKSPWYTVSAALNQEWTHGLGDVELDDFDIEFRAKVNDASYIAGDIVKVITDNNGTNRGYALYLTAGAGTVGIQIASTNVFYVPDRTTGALAGITMASWEFRFVVKKFTIGDIPDITRVGLVPLKEFIITSGDSELDINLQEWFNDYYLFTLEVLDFRCQTDGTQGTIIFSNDGGVTFEGGASAYHGTGIYNSGGSVGGFNTDTTNTPIGADNTGTASDETVTGTVTIYNADNPNSQTVFRNTCYIKNHNGIYLCNDYWYRRLAQEINTHVRIYASSGNLAQGELILYGKRKAA